MLNFNTHLKNLLLYNPEILKKAIDFCNTYSNDVYDLLWQPMEDLPEILENTDSMDVINMMHPAKHFSRFDAYVRIVDGYLESCNEPKYKPSDVIPVCKSLINLYETKDSKTFKELDPEIRSLFEKKAALENTSEDMKLYFISVIDTIADTIKDTSLTDEDIKDILENMITYAMDNIFEEE